MKDRLAVAVFVLFSCGSCLMGQSCTELASASSGELLTYLNRGKASQTSSCTEYALRRLGERKYLEAVPVALRYLDFRREPTEAEKHGLASMNSWYPATIALFEIGKPALPYLVDLLATKTTEVVRKNALETVMDISSDDFVSGVRLIRAAAEKVRGNDSRLSEEEVRLTQASREAAKMCPPRVRSDCEAALYGAAPKR